MAAGPIYTAHNSPLRMALLTGVLALLSAGLAFVIDLTPLIAHTDLGGGTATATKGEFVIWLLPWLGWLGLALCAFQLPRLFHRKVEIAIGADGITYPSALQEVLPWDRVARLAVQRMNMQKVLAVHIRDAASFPIRPLVRRTAQLNKRSGDYGDFTIMLTRTSGNFEDLVKAAECFCPVER